VIHNPPHLEALDISPILTERMLVIGPPARLIKAGPHPKRFRVRDFGDLPLILPNMAHSNRRLVETIAVEHGVRLRTKIEADSVSFAKAMVAEGLGYTILTYAAVHDEVKRGELTAYPIVQPVVTNQVNLVMLRDPQRPRHVAAAGELRGRLRQLGFPRVQARTFHSAALRQAQYFWPSAMGSELPRISDQRAGLMAEAAARQLGQRVESGTLRDLLTEVSWAKVSNVPPADYAELAAEQGREVARVPATGVGSIYARYEKLKADRAVIDFDDVLLCAVALLSDHDDVRTQVRRAYRHLLVDEFQDLTPAHLLLVRLLAAPAFDVFGVGDDDQVIYGYNGADPDFLVRYGHYFPGAHEHALEVNYRCPAPVVSAASTLLTHNRVRVPKAIRTPRRDGALVVHEVPTGDLSTIAIQTVTNWVELAFTPD